MLCMGCLLLNARALLNTASQQSATRSHLHCYETLCLPGWGGVSFNGNINILKGVLAEAQDSNAVPGGYSAQD